MLFFWGYFFLGQFSSASPVLGFSRNSWKSPPPLTLSRWSDGIYWYACWALPFVVYSGNSAVENADTIEQRIKMERGKKSNDAGE